MADIFREIEEDLRRDQIAKLWQRHGRLVVAVAVLVVLATGGVVEWRNWQQRQTLAAGARYAEIAALAAADPAKAAQDFERLAANGAGGYRLLARLQAAVIEVKGSSRPAGLAALDDVAADASVDRPYRDLATVLAALYRIDEAPGDIPARLQPLTAADDPWRFTALELTALARMKTGDRAGALKTYQQLADDLDAPESLRARAAEIVGAYSHQG